MIGSRLLHSFRRSLVAIIGAALVFTAASIAAKADDAPPLPLRPPPDWTMLPTSLVHPELSWSEKGISALNVASMSVAVPPSVFAKVIKTQVSQSGTIASSSDAPICDAPAYQVNVKMFASPATLTEQVQSLDGLTYIITYLHPAATADPDITTMLASFCGSKTLAKATTPTDWVNDDARVLGIWVGSDVGQTVIVTSQRPLSDAQQLARIAAQKAFQGAKVSIVSSSTGTLCGLPASFVTARIATPQGPELEMQAETTQSSTIAYTAMYAHPATLPVSAAATTSLSSLCANGVVTPSPSV